MSAKAATLDVLKINVFWKKADDLVVFVSDVPNETLSYDSNYIVDVVMWPKFGNSSISRREAIINSMLQGFDQKNHFFEEWSWFRFNNLGLRLAMALKWVKIKSQKILGANSYVYRSYRGKIGWGSPFAHPQSLIGLITLFFPDKRSSRISFIMEMPEITFVFERYWRWVVVTSQIPSFVWLLLLSSKE